MSQFHQLAAIMFADISGYTAIMQDDEAMALQIRNKFRVKLEEEMAGHNGRILEFRGDGALCIFSSAIEGVRAALALQLDMQTAPQVPLRIGIHTGDVIVDEGNTVYGDGVNIASRIESFAVPGSIFISGRVYEDIKNQKDIQTLSLGKYALKNIKEPVELFAISNPGLLVPELAALEGKGEKLQSESVLVLPFVNMSNDPEQEYFSDGLTEELISGLSKLKELKVISRTTSMKYKGTGMDTKTIGLETDTHYILEGSVRKQGNNLRITAQFVDAKRDVHLWAESYGGTMDDIFDIQEKVSLKIIAGLRMQLTRDQQQVLKKRYTDNTEAYQLYLQGRFFWKKRNEQGLKSAIRHFEKALEKDPDYALAWAGLADTYSLMGEYTSIPRSVFLPRQMEAVKRALELDDQLGEAHISLAIALMLNEWDWKNAEKEYKRGIELDPEYATGHHWYGELLMFTGRMEEAFREFSLAVELEPFSQGILKDKGIFYYYTGEYDKAIDIAEVTLELDPDFAPAHRLLSMAYLGQGLFDKAMRENQSWGNATGNKTKTDVAMACIYAYAGQEDEAKRIIEDTTIEKILTENDYRGVALVYAALGETEKTFEWLEKSYEQQEESLCSLKIDPKFKLLHSDPRFSGLLKKIGLV
ncbi:MAG: tetratricopeptide repeat protein [Ferruginibacter sp.]|nr:tetratricopeptide repeat protein [Chitinophagaceae bacterium]